MKKIYLLIIASLFLMSFASAISDLGTFKQHECINLYQYCDDCTYVNLTTIKYANGTIDTSFNDAMNKSDQDFTYNFCGTQSIGDYYFINCGDKNGGYACEQIDFHVSSTGGEGSQFWLILITCLAVIFFIASLIAPEEFFVYISGVLWLLGGIFLMVSGIDVLNDQNTRNLAYVYIGIGILFTVGAYIYNWIYENKGEPEEY